MLKIVSDLRVHLSETRYILLISYIYTKRWIFTILWKTKRGLKTISSNCSRLAASLLGSCVSIWQLKVWGRNIYVFTLQNTVWSILIAGFLEVERINKSYGGAEIKNIYERLCLYFYLVGFLYFLAGEG